MCSRLVSARTGLLLTLAHYGHKAGPESLHPCSRQRETALKQLKSTHSISFIKDLKALLDCFTSKEGFVVFRCCAAAAITACTRTGNAI
jgi:hypothetical protein